MAIIDFKKELRDIYQSSARYPTLVDVPPMQFAMVDGHGDTDSPMFKSAVEALYAISYGIKMRPKNGISPPGYFQYVIPPLEGLWWTTNGNPELQRRDKWNWTLMLYQPVFVKPDLMESVAEEGMRKKPNPLLKRVRLERLREGISVQMTHVGPYSGKASTLQVLMAYIKQHGYRIRGKHHEIYLTNPRRTSPDKWRTVIRYPVVRA